MATLYFTGPLFPDDFFKVSWNELCNLAQNAGRKETKFWDS